MRNIKVKTICHSFKFSSILREFLKRAYLWNSSFYFAEIQTRSKFDDYKDFFNVSDIGISLYIATRTYRAFRPTTVRWHAHQLPLSQRKHSLWILVRTRKHFYLLIIFIVYPVTDFWWFISLISVINSSNISVIMLRKFWRQLKW